MGRPEAQGSRAACVIDYVYDLETYPNVFTMCVLEPSTASRRSFEISDWRDDSILLIDFLWQLQNTESRMVGFNNMGFDWPILAHFRDGIHSMENIAHQLWVKAQQIIQSDDRFGHVIWQPEIPQLDLYKIHHFDNVARSTSLKMLEFNMRMDTIQELPFDPMLPLAQENVPDLIEYNFWDVEATAKFYQASRDMIEFREELSARYRHDFTNFNDTKIGKQYFIMELEKAQPGSCYYRNPETGKREMRQTHRTGIALSEVIFPYIQFQHPEFQRVHTWLSHQTAWDANAIKDISATIDGFKFDFGRGGIHGSISNSIVHSDLDHIIIDLDVTSYYPSLAIVNRLHPEHLGETFCDIYADIKAQRAQHPKGSAPNKMLKLALNGVYGDTGNAYSPFLDMKYLLSITINGQLLLCMLAEHLMRIPGLQMIQINTDGLTVRLPYDRVDDLEHVAQWWQEFTCLELEEARYSRMFIRDVNNYLAEDMSGSVKRKGAYEWKPPAERNPSGWHQNLSAMVIPMAAEAHLTRGVRLDSFIYHHPDIMDFMLRTKIPRDSHVEIGGKRYQRVTRYMVTTKGQPMVKVSPPPAGYAEGQWKRANGLTDQFYRSCLNEPPVTGGELDTTGRPWDERINTKNKSKYGERRLSIEAGWLVTPFNVIDAPIDRRIINFDYYIQEAEKLVRLQ